ncbi:MAG: response regulator transcription factor [Lachnospiraceae bacterium]|jgi:DNA-binding response OmpR family regulator|nr:response regulator transcription factor [Lachnospiraceae bacterium]
MYRILVVDDEEAIRNGLTEYLEFMDYEVVQASDGMEAIKLCKEQDFDAIVMDVMMPKIDGFTAIKEIKKEKDIPTLMLSARSEEYDKLHGFDLGIDDYVTKPFSLKEVAARLNVIIGRHKASTSATEEIIDGKPHERYVFDGLEIDMTARSVKINNEEVSLTPKEYELLFYLVENKGIALTRESILSKVWGYDFYGDDRTVDTHIKTLRNALGEYKDKIVTLRGTGYRFDA